MLPLPTSRAHQEARRRRAAPSVLVATSALVVVTSVVLGACGGDDGSDARAATTTAERSTTAGADPTEPTVTAGTVPPGHEQPIDAVFPDAGTSRRFDDPASAARAFAVDWVGFTDPVVVADERTLDDGSAEVDIRPAESGSDTTVHVRPMPEDGTWWVTGARTRWLQLEAPAAGDVVTSPLELNGQSTAYEGTVDVSLRADAQDTPLIQGFVQGGANGQMGPFSGSIPFDVPGADAGAVVLSTRGGEDGRIWEATVVRVRFRPGPAPSPGP